MTTCLFLVRHGATQLTAEDRFSGEGNVHLSDEGRMQAARLAERLKDEPIQAVYSSPLDRAAETASILAQPHGLRPAYADGLREVTHGHWEGMSHSDVQAQFPEEYAAWIADPFNFAPQGGTSGKSVLSAALPVLHGILEEHRDGTVVLVSHRATLRLLICSILGIDPRGYRDRLDQAPACLNLLEFKDSSNARLMLFNDVSHYAGPRYPATWG